MQDLIYKLLALAILVAASIFLMVPKPGWSEGKNERLKAIADLQMRLGIDLQGGTRLEYEIPEGSRTQVKGADKMSQLVSTLARRIDNLGLLEPKIESTGEFRFVIELPGVSNDVVQRVKTLMESQGKLELKLVANLQSDPQLQAEDDRIRQLIPDLEQSLSDVTDRVEQGQRVVTQLNRDELSKRYVGQWRYYHYYELRDSGDVTDQYLLVENPVVIGGTDIVNASSQVDTFGPVPGFSLSSTARTQFCAITRKHVSSGDDPRNLAIILDGRLVSAPSIKSEICDGSAIIQGTYTVEEVDDMINVFNSGKLPAVPSLLREETTGPSIGVSAQKAGIWAAVLGMLVIIAFMFIYYLGAGVVANLALLINAILIGGVLTFFGATLTLPGVAGLILTIGMAVDANILIYERIREELAKGKTLGQAISNGYERAFVTIFDANVTTLITAAILFWFGTGSVQGFALTLIIGILTSMFTALLVTRLLFTFTERAGLLTEMKMLNLVGTPKINFMGYAPKTAVVSLVLVVAGLVAFGAQFDRVQGIDLKGGTAFRISSDQPMSGAEIKERLKGVNGIVNGWIDSNEWIEKLGIEVEPGSPEGPEKPPHNPLLGVEPQGLDIDYTETRPEPEAGEFYEYMVRSRSLPDSDYRLVQLALGEGGEGVTPMVVTEKTEISSKIAKETALNALVAILFAIGAILVYITFRFEFQFGIGAVLALVHDVSIALGAIVLFKSTRLVDVEINLPIIAALLTVIGYSLNDTIVVFDRIRENLKGSHKTTAEMVNSSVNQTLSRTVLTSITTLFVVLILFFLNYGKGSIIEGFSFTLLVGVVVGTYSSVFVASPFLVWWHNRTVAKEESGKGKKA